MTNDDWAERYLRLRALLAKPEAARVAQAFLAAPYLREPADAFMTVLYAELPDITAEQTVMILLMLPGLLEK